MGSAKITNKNVWSPRDRLYRIAEDVLPREIFNLWPRKVDRGKTSHRVPLERDFEGAEDGLAWEHYQAGDEVQIPQRKLLFLGWNSNSPMGSLCRVRERGGWRGVGGGMSEKNLYCFTREEVKEVTARHDRSDRSDWPVRLVTPWQLWIEVQGLSLLEEF